MPTHNFAPVYDHYPEVIDQMPETFTSHQFILRLAQQYQTVYIEALYDYRNTTREGTPAPFMNVHREMSKHLHNYPKLVRQVSDKATSVDIFGQSNDCAEWTKQGVSGAA